MNVGSIVSLDWQKSAEGETVLQYFYDPQTVGRKIFGILERPSLPHSIEEVSYKVFVTGKSGVSRSATIARLCGAAFKHVGTYTETLGIRKSNVYWPVKIWDKIILFKLHIWDADDSSIKKYSHILPACRQKADANMYVFSFMDKNSFADLPQLIGKITQEGDNPTNIAIGTGYNVTGRMEVSSADVEEFEMKWQMPVLKMDSRWSGERNEVHEVAPTLNIICERLWIRDQEYILKQGLAR
ncbi:ciliogenesis and planar polarity effector 2-like [Bacillus rossius redtenbacheri]|uniref:ciliogenesis and planar polarity effector 2-like n=1 Tax=Bacillus rossius redtenbacheri TaxID=93214 RepID=UPI002FDEAFD6